MNSKVWTLLVLALLLAAYPVASAVVTNEVLPFTLTFFSECTGAAITIQGEQHLVNTRTESAGGGVNGSSHIEFTGVASSSSGATYTVSGGFNVHINQPAGGTVSVTSVTRIILHPQSGGAAPETLTATLHVTITPDGTRIEINRIDAHC